MQDANAWSYIVYPQLVRKLLWGKSPRFKSVSGTFIFVVIRFIEGDYAKRLSVEAMSQIKEVGGIFLQFKTFTYIHVASSKLHPNRLTRYPFDRLILLEVVRKIELAYERA